MIYKKSLLFKKLAIFEKFYLLCFNREKYHTQNTKITRVNNFAVFSKKNNIFLKTYRVYIYT